MVRGVKPTWTVDDIMAEDPWMYTRTDLVAMFKGRSELTLVEILRRPDIIARNKIWLASRPYAIEGPVLIQWLNTVTNHAVAMCCPPQLTPPSWATSSTYVWAYNWIMAIDRTVSSATRALLEVGADPQDTDPQGTQEPMVHCMLAAKDTARMTIEARTTYAMYSSCVVPVIFDHLQRAVVGHTSQLLASVGVPSTSIESARMMMHVFVTECCAQIATLLALIDRRS